MTTDQAMLIAWPDPSCTCYSYHGKGRDRPRYYQHQAEGWEYPGVTTILKPWDKEGLVKWGAGVEREFCIDTAAGLWGAARQAQWSVAQFIEHMRKALGTRFACEVHKQDAADIGTAAHKMVQWKIKHLLDEPQGPPPMIPDGSELAVMAWEDHWNQAGIVPLRTEQPVWSHTYRFAGTVDLFCLRDGKLGLVDYKTSKGIYGSQHLQVAAYCEAAEELLGVPIEWAEIWRSPKSLDDVRFERVELGNRKQWDGEKLVTRRDSRATLFSAFAGIHQAWSIMIEPAA